VIYNILTDTAIEDMHKCALFGREHTDKIALMVFCKVDNTFFNREITIHMDIVREYFLMFFREIIYQYLYLPAGIEVIRSIDIYKVYLGIQDIGKSHCFLEGFSWGEAAECGAPLKPVQLESGSPESAKTAHAFDATMIRTVKQPG